MFFLLSLIGVLTSCQADNCAGNPRTFLLRTLASSTFCLAEQGDAVGMSNCDPSYPEQNWILNYTSGFVDAAGSAAFMLVNAGSGKALRHRTSENEQVDVAAVSGLSSCILWTRSLESYRGGFAIRPFENTLLNLDVDHGERKQRGVTQSSRLILFPWHTGDNQLWEFIDN